MVFNLDVSLIVFVVGFMMAIGGAVAWLSKDTSASVRNVELTKSILDRVEVAIQKSDLNDAKISEVNVKLETEILKMGQVIQKAEKQEKNINVTLPHSVQFNVVYTPRPVAKPVEAKPVVLPPAPYKRPVPRSRANN